MRSSFHVLFFSPFCDAFKCFWKSTQCSSGTSRVERGKLLTFYTKLRRKSLFSPRPPVETGNAWYDFYMISCRNNNTYSVTLLVLETRVKNGGRPDRMRWRRCDIEDSWPHGCRCDSKTAHATRDTRIIHSSFSAANCKCCNKATSQQHCNNNSSVKGRYRLLERRLFTRFRSFIDRLCRILTSSNTSSSVIRVSRNAERQKRSKTGCCNV